MKIKYILALSLVGLLFGLALAAVKPLPDLTVSQVKIDSSKVNKNGKVIITYTVKNVGKAAAPASLTKIGITSGKEKVIYNPAVPPLSPGGSYSGNAAYTVTSKKHYVFTVTADYNNSLMESNETNNQNSASFSFGKAF